MDKKTITIKKENWKILKRLTLDNDFKTHDDTLEFLFKKEKLIK